MLDHLRQTSDDAQPANPTRGRGVAGWQTPPVLLAGLSTSPAQRKEVVRETSCAMTARRPGHSPYRHYIVERRRGEIDRVFTKTKRCIGILAFAALLSWLASPSYAVTGTDRHAGSVTAYVGASVLNQSGNEFDPNTTIIVRDAKIAAVGRGDGCEASRCAGQRHRRERDKALCRSSSVLGHSDHTRGSQAGFAGLVACRGLPGSTKRYRRCRR